MRTPYVLQDCVSDILFLADNWMERALRLRLSRGFNAAPGIILEVRHKLIQTQMTVPCAKGMASSLVRLLEM